MSILEFFQDNAEFSFPERSLFVRGRIVSTDKKDGDPHMHGYILTLHLREPISNAGEINELFGGLLGNEADDVRVIPLAMPSSGDPRNRKHDRVTVESTQRVLSNLLVRLEAQHGNPLAADSLGRRDGAALGKPND